MRTLASSLLFLLVACSDSAGVTNVTGATDGGGRDGAADGAVASDAGGSKDSGPDAPTTCDVAPLPTNVPAITSSVIIADADGGGVPPTSSGGDEKGVWLYSKVSIYLEASAKGAVDPVASTITGGGWLALDGTRYRTSSSTETTLVTSVAGTIVRGTSTIAYGTYSYASAGGALTFTSECRVSNSDLGGSPLGFTRLTDTTARLVVTTQNALGNFIIVTDLTKGS